MTHNRPRAFSTRYWVLLVSCLVALNFARGQSPNISLAGQWRFALDARDTGISDKWFTRDLSDTIQLPGALQSQGYGNKISIQTPWILSLYDRNWFLRADYAAYTNADDVKVPFLCQPPRHYLGAAWYQRDIYIPADWKNRRVVLFLERPHWESRVWLDDQLIGTNNSLCVPHEFELGVSLKPGKHRLTVRVDNRMILPYRPDAHSVSDSLAQSWNGVVGKMELLSTAPIWIDQVQVFPNIEKKTALLKIVFGNVTGTNGHGRLDLFYDGDAPLTTIPENRTNILVNCQPNGSSVEINCGWKDGITAWNEFTPRTYEIVFMFGGHALVAGQEISVIDGRKITLGLREIRTERNQLLLNGNPVYLRGTHNGGDFPLTGYPPTDVEYWRNIFQTCKDWGLNHMRFHSFCPPEAAFEAADELGIYLQIEPGMWNEFSPGGGMEKMLYAETECIIKAYGNHPSFVLLSASNEAHGNWKPVLAKWVEHFRAADPRRLYTPDTGWAPIEAPGSVTNADYLSVGRIGSNRTRGESGWFGRDYERSLRGVDVPVLAHELGQWCAYPDFDVINKFTGYMRPGNYEIFRDSAQAHAVLAFNKEFAAASGKFQLACYKEEIEANLRTRGMAGFQLLDLHDYVGQGTALVGLLDPFWESKGYATPAEFKQFCNTVVPLARLTKRVFTTADKFEVPFEIANFSPSALTNAPITWAIADSSGHVVTNGWLGATVPIGKNFPLGTISADLASLPAPAVYKLLVEVQKPHFENSWSFWLYPAADSNLPPADVLMTSSWDDAGKKLDAGGKVLFVPRNTDLDWSSPPLDRVPIFWNRLMNPGWTRMLGLWCDTNHPALAEFPTADHCDWQWTELLHNTRAVNLERLPRELRPIVAAVDDWNRNWKLGLIFEANVGRGKLLVCSIDLNRNTSPVAQQLRRSLLDYMVGNKFIPKINLSPDEFQSLHFDDRIMQKLSAKVQANGRNGEAVIDGDPNTFWSVGERARNTPAVPFPHELTVSFASPVAMNGVVLMPRQNDRDHLGDTREYALASSDDGTNWTDITRGTLLSTWSPQEIHFGKTITAKQLKFTALSGFGADTSTALAELAVMYAGPKLPESSEGQIEFRRARSTSSDVDEGDTAPQKPKARNR